MKKLLLTILTILIGTTGAMAHCQIPCGIYDDQMRINMIAEYATTIEKSMNQINELDSVDDEAKENDHQFVRWVMNKEKHAQDIQDIVSDYFIAQRIKFADTGDEEAYKKYTKSLVLLHQIAVYAMKAKQTTDLAHIASLRKALEEFKALYFMKEEHQH